MTLSSAVANLETKPLRRVGDEDLSLRAGDVVEVRSKAEILSTLDQDGRLENLPFMSSPFGQRDARDVIGSFSKSQGQYRQTAEAQVQLELGGSQV
jgi:hypothetical protein